MNHICVFSNKKQCSAFSSFPILPGIWLQMITSPRSSGVNQPLIKCLHCGAAGHWIHTDPQLASVSPESLTHLSNGSNKSTVPFLFLFSGRKEPFFADDISCCSQTFPGCLDRILDLWPSAVIRNSAVLGFNSVFSPEPAKINKQRINTLHCDYLTFQSSFVSCKNNLLFWIIV